MKEHVAGGTTLSDAMRRYSSLYPSNFVSIIATGEKSGTLDNSFSYMAEFYSKEVSNKTKKLPTVVEPILLIFIGVIVGFVAISIIMPIYQLTRGLQG
jgi:type II secretory pathway component PulF